ncbi:MAG: hypothetical protein UZ05_CHB002002806 [Chlorobi bacterium OLB5]|nr:MAG: hypothetical protein UZ05_CHB002002806 [Chlorobi bacterium OLB5]
MSKIYVIRIITVLMLVSLPFLGSDCEDIINQINTPTGTLQGNWTLIYNAGTLMDICPGEKVTFPNNSSGTATLTCPGQTPIDRNYTVSGSTLTYSASGIEYSISFTQENQLVLTGINNNRILYYGATISDNSPVTGKNSSNYNSSEIIKLD